MKTTVTTPNTGRCPTCGHDLPAGPDSLCPRCLLAGAAATQQTAQPEAPNPPHTLENVRSAFPNLEIIEIIGAGGMGTVYRARQPKLERLVALKILPEHLARQATFAERFHREARLLARLHHPHIVSVFDFGQAGPFYYLLMELVEGANLRQSMRAGRFSASQALQVVPQICEALQFAHEQGVLHRDIKPENILLDRHGRVKIADFGIAKLVDDNAQEVTLTASGAVLGTPAYMAPEQIESPTQVDHRADIYSLGVVFYELLTGELPLGRFAPPSQKTPLDQRVDEIVLRALAKEKELRQQSASEVKTQIEQVESTSSSPVPVQALGPTSSRADFVLCNPSLPRMAQAITIYTLVLAPLFWVISLGLADFTHLAEHPLANLLEGSWKFFGEITGGFATTIILIIGGLKLRRLDPRGPAWLRAGFWSRLALETVGLILMAVVLLLDHGGTSTPPSPPLGEILIVATMMVALGFEVAMLVWLTKHRHELRKLRPEPPALG